MRNTPSRSNTRWSSPSMSVMSIARSSSAKASSSSCATSCAVPVIVPTRMWIASAIGRALYDIRRYHEGRPLPRPPRWAASKRGDQMVTFDTHPDRYVHWRLAVDGAIATLTLDVNEDHGIVPGYKLKLNSYDLGVDIELADALQRLRFEHPGVQCMVLTGGKERMFCSGANIYMLA